jgi:hypothetical protein
MSNDNSGAHLRCAPLVFMICDSYSTSDVRIISNACCVLNSPDAAKERLKNRKKKKKFKDLEKVC